jgi:hypothetical protein
MEVFSRSEEFFLWLSRRGKKNSRGFIVPYPNSREAAMVNQLAVYAVTHIREVVEFLDNIIPIKLLMPYTVLIFFRTNTGSILISGMCADNTDPLQIRHGKTEPAGWGL